MPSGVLEIEDMDNFMYGVSNYKIKSLCTTWLWYTMRAESRIPGCSAQYPGSLQEQQAFSEVEC